MRPGRAALALAAVAQCPAHPSNGVPVVGFTWYRLTDQVDWDIALREPLGNVDPVGLFDLNRDPGRSAVLPASDRYASRRTGLS